MSGTSMAGPHIAGVVALMRASNPNVDVITIKEVLMATAIDLGPAGEDQTYGHGFVDAYEAVLAVIGGIGTVEGYVLDSSGKCIPEYNCGCFYEGKHYEVSILKQGAKVLVMCQTSNIYFFFLPY